MVQNIFSHPIILISGAIVGLIFGFLLQKGHASQFNTIVNQLLLKDFTLLKIFLTAIIVGSIGVYGLLSLDLLTVMHVKMGSVLGVFLGGIIMGNGMAILGYCPGTCVAAAGQGSRDAWWGILGMLAGATMYAEVYPWFEKHVNSIAKIKIQTLPQLFHLSPWTIITFITLCTVVGFWLLQRKKHQSTISSEIKK